MNGYEIIENIFTYEDCILDSARFDRRLRRADVEYVVRESVRLCARACVRA